LFADEFPNRFIDPGCGRIDAEHAMWEQLVVHLQGRATASINVLLYSESDLKIMIVSTNKEMTVTLVPERNSVRWETANEYGFESCESRSPG